MNTSSEIKYRFIATALSAALTSSAVHAAFPDKPVQLVVPFAAGGGADVLARIIAPELGRELGQPVVIVNRGGGGTVIGATSVAAAAPDGYTLLIGSNSVYTVNPALRQDLRFDPPKDFQPLAVIGSVANVLIVGAAQPWRDVGGLVRAVRAEPNRYAYGSYGVGTVANFAGEMFKSATKTSLTHVAYRGSAPAMTDLVSGHVPIVFDSTIAVLTHAQSGSIRPLAVTSARRSVLLPEVPTMAEAGYPEVDFGSWMTIVAPAGLPPEVARKLRTSIVAAIQRPDVQERLLKAGLEPSDPDVADWPQRVRAEIARLKAVAARSGITAD